jgi:2,3-dihydro-2,3-dihydroxybenzoate dehydrogenase
MTVSAECAIVTGAASGIGRAVAQRLAREHPVYLLDKNADALDAVAQSLQHEGHAATAYVVDVSNPEQVQQRVAQIAALHAIGKLANVAGMLIANPLEQTTAGDWRKLFAVNCDGVFWMIRAVAPHMKARGKGSIVTVTSNAGVVPRRGLSAYCASKAAALHLTRCAALELAEFGVRCNSVSPGSTETPMLKELWQQGGSITETLHGNLRDFRVGVPLRRLASPDDVANVVGFLLSDAARHITMEDVRIDGGATLGA